MKKKIHYPKYSRPLLAACLFLSMSPEGFLLSAHPDEPAGTPMSVVQQKGTVITGIIKDASGMELPGVNVVEKGSTNGTMSDMDGKFSITVSGPKAVLQFSYVGFQTRELIVGNQKTIAVALLI